MVVSFNFMGSRTIIYLIYAQNSFPKKRLDQKKKILKGGKTGHFRRFSKGYRKAKWSKVSDFGGKFKSTKNIGKTTGMLAQFNFVASRTILDWFYAKKGL